MIDAERVRLGASPATKEEAIRMVAGLLADGGNIDPGYAESMLGREKVANTFLGEGIAIPHGMLKDREMIRETGIAVVQVPEGVEWNPGEHVRLVVGIAAASDEHLQILANLTQVLADAEEVERLSTTSNPAHVVDRLTRGPGDTEARTGGTMEHELLEGYASADVVISGSSGLHARPATFLVDVAKGFEADVRVRHDGKVANGKSLASLLSLGADGGSTVTLLTSGPDERDALRALEEAVEAGLGEEEDEAPRRRSPSCPSGARRARPPACPGSRPRPGSRSARCGISSAGGSSSSARPRTRRPRSRSCAAASSPRAPSCAISTRRSRPSRARARPRSSAPTRRSSTTRTSSARPTRRSAAASRPAGRGAR